MAVIYVYFSIFQKVDEEDYGGISEILKEGLMTSFATFLVSILTVCFLLIAILVSLVQFQVFSNDMISQSAGLI